MKLDLETLPNCKVRIHVEIPSSRVREEKENITRGFQQQARFPGFRPGKAPASVVEKKFGKEIQEELFRALVGEAGRKALKEHSLKVLSAYTKEDPVVAPDESLSFDLEVITEPEFDLPAYTGLEVTRLPEVASAEEIDRYLETSRERLAKYPPVEGRPCRREDYAVLDYFATLDGQPLDTAMPELPETLVKNAGYWLRLAPDAFLPGFTEGIEGMEKDQSREIEITLPGDFAIEALRGKSVQYNVTLKSIHDRELPELDDSFASMVAEGQTLAGLRDLIAEDIVENKKRNNDRRNRTEVIKVLRDAVDFELPENMLRNEAERVLTDIVDENQSRGVPEEELKAHHTEILEGARQSAKDRLKTSFLLLRIAREEKLEATERDLADRIQLMSIRYRMPANKLRKELEKRDAIGSIREEILTAKALDSVVAAATVRTVTEEDAAAQPGS